MKFITFEQNIVNTAKFLVSEIGVAFSSLQQDEAIELLKVKTRECFEYNLRDSTIEEVANGATIWGCYKGVSCLFTQCKNGNAMEIFTTDHNIDNSTDIYVTYQVVL